MARILRGSRYLILIPILGLGIAAAVFFVLGGISLIRLLGSITAGALGFSPAEAHADTGLLIFEVVEHVHIFLVGTVLYITAIGLYQLFISDVQFHGWLRIESTEELETNLIGVTVVVLAVNFMGAMFAGTQNLLQQGAGIALPIAALGVFVGLRAWAAKISRPDNGPEPRHRPHLDDQPPSG